ncbi:MAG: hypothetical protein ACK58T_39855, partial [Phycisphaerae bacterium]
PSPWLTAESHAARYRSSPQSPLPPCFVIVRVKSASGSHNTSFLSSIESLISGIQDGKGRQNEDQEGESNVTRTFSTLTKGNSSR